MDIKERGSPGPHDKLEYLIQSVRELCIIRHVWFVWQRQRDSQLIQEGASLISRESIPTPALNKVFWLAVLVSSRNISTDTAHPTPSPEPEHKRQTPNQLIAVETKVSNQRQGHRNFRPHKPPHHQCTSSPVSSPSSSSSSSPHPVSDLLPTFAPATDCFVTLLPCNPF